MELDARFEERILSLIAGAVPSRFRKIEITNATHLQKELGLDSIAILSLVLRFEETFGVNLEQMNMKVDVGRLRTVADLIRTSKQILQQPSASPKTD